MFKDSAQKSTRTGMVGTCLLLCLACAPVLGDETNNNANMLSGDTLRLIQDSDQNSLVSQQNFSLIEQTPAAGLDFDLGGSEKRKLQLQLNQPLTLSMGTEARLQGNGNGLLGLDATLSLPVADGLSLAGGVKRQMGSVQFQQLGSIQCNNGILRPDSYTASGCRFVDEPYSSIERRQVRLGALFDIGNASASISWFTQDAELKQPGVRQLNRGAGATLLDPGLLTPVGVNPLLPTNYLSQPLQHFDSQVSGVDLNFRLGIATDQAGDIRLGLAMTRVLDAGYQGIYSGSPDILGWTTAEPFDTARMNVEWSRGSFSSGIQGFYREPVNFLDRNNLDSMTTFDVHFTWRTPWNANLSVGASNVLSAGVKDAGQPDNQPVDPFESVYGRIPYVRYQQDL
jgi:hypothetical protein